MTSLRSEPVFSKPVSEARAFSNRGRECPLSSTSFQFAPSQKKAGLPVRRLALSIGARAKQLGPETLLGRG